jgi:hypothetical protein
MVERSEMQRRGAVVLERLGERWDCSFVSHTLGLAVVIACVVAVWTQRAAARAHAERRDALLAVEAHASAEDRALGAQLDRLSARILSMSHPSFDEPAVRALDDDTLARLVAEPGMYLRAVGGELTSLDTLAVAAQASRKDAFVACLLRPPTRGDGESVRAAATAYRWSVALERVSPNVFDYGLLLSEARPFSNAFLDTVRKAESPNEIRMLEIVAARVDQGALGRARRARLGAAAWLALLIDDLPPVTLPKSAPALAVALTGSRLELAKVAPHRARAILLRLSDDQVVASVPAKLDVGVVVARDVLDDVEEILACQGALALRPPREDLPTTRTERATDHEVSPSNAEMANAHIDASAPRPAVSAR